MAIKANTDKAIAEELKAKSATSKNGKSSTTKESAKIGANRITQFINDVSDKASDQVSDAITAAIIQKSMMKLGIGDGELTKAAMAQFSDAFSEVLVTDLPSLTGADGGDSRLFLPSSLDVEKLPESLN